MSLAKDLKKLNEGLEVIRLDMENTQKKDLSPAVYRYKIYLWAKGIKNEQGRIKSK